MNRGRMADIAKKTKRYSSDLTDEEWERIAPFLPAPAKKGRKPHVEPCVLMPGKRLSGETWVAYPSVDC